MPTRLGRFGDWEQIRSSCVSGTIDGARPFFGGSAAYERMDLVRRAINEIRTSWDQYGRFMSELRELMAQAPAHGFQLRDDDRMELLFSSHKSWAAEDPASISDGNYSAIRLYTSEAGYQRIFSTINAAFRAEELIHKRPQLRAAAFLVELLTIDLFNYRLLHPGADAFCGRVYRGMCVTTAELASFYEAGSGPISERYIAVPLSMMSASSVRSPAVRFALEVAAMDPGKHAVLWEIDVVNLDEDLLSFFRSRYPNGVVSSICAVPIDDLSDYPDEREVLLRGPHLQIVQVSLDDKRPRNTPAIHRVEAVMLNSNRDHLTTIASNEGPDRMARDLFRTVVLLHRSRICRDRAETYGKSHDAELYRTAVLQNQKALTAYGY